MPYNYEAAKASGLSDEEIARYLSDKYGYAYEDALKSGVPVQEIVQHLLAKDAAGPIAQRATQTGEATLSPGLAAGRAVASVAGPAAQQAFKLAASPILFAADRLAQAGSQGAGAVIRGVREGTPIGIPLEYARGVGRGLMGLPGPEATAEIRATGYQGMTPEQAAVANALGAAAGLRVPVGDIARTLTSPEAAGAVASTLAMAPADFVGGKVLEGVRAVSQIPRVAEALDVARKATAPVGRLLSRGYALGHEAREPLRQIVRGARGEERLLEATFSDMLDQAQAAIVDAAKAQKIDPSVAEENVRHLLEVARRDPGVLDLATPDEKRAALALDQLRDLMPRLRKFAHLKERRLGGPLGVEQGGVEFVPRIFTPEAAQKLGLGRRNVEFSELGTPIPGVRAANRALTSRELEAQLAKGVGKRGPIKEPLEPLLRAFEMKGKQTARSVANARALQEVAGRFGVSAQEAGPGWRKLSDLGVLQGFTKEAKQGVPGLVRHGAELPKLPLSDAYVDPEVFRYLDEFTRETSPAKIPLLSGFLRKWKPLVTTVNPQFVSRNFQWNAIIGWIRGNKDPRNWTDAAELLSRASPLNRVRGLRLTNDELRVEMLKNGVIGQGTMAEFGSSGRRILRGLEKVSPGRISRAGTRLNQAGEDLSRAAFYLAMRRRGLGELEAAKQVALTYFDYGRDALSPFLGGLRESAVPFVVWTRNILPLTFRSLIENPSAFAGLGAVGRESARAAGLAPENRARLGPEFKETTAITMKGEKPGRFNAIPLSQVGYFDVSRALSDPRKFAMTQLSPLVSGPLEVAGIIKNAFTGKDSNDIVELPPIAGKFAQLNPEAAKKIGIRYAQDGRAVGPQWMNTILRTGGPLGTTVFDLWSDDPKARLRVARWLTGVSVRTDLNPATGKKIEQIQAKVARKEEKRHVRQGTRIIQQIKRGER